MDNEIEAARLTVAQLEHTRDTARKFLASKQLEYAQMHLEGARNAAAKGDTRPAEWALTHVKTEGKTAVDPPVKDTAGAGQGLKVFLGINIGGLPQEAVTAEIIPMEPPLLDAEASNGVDG